jgi:hypothetical protein
VVSLDFGRLCPVTVLDRADRNPAEPASPSKFIQSIDLKACRKDQSFIDLRDSSRRGKLKPPYIGSLA